jgi:hypothetical protein
MKNIFLPTTTWGKKSVYLIVFFTLSLSIFFLLVHLGERGGATFFSNPKLTTSILLAAISAISAFFTGLFSISAQKERSILVFLSTILGFFVLLFASAELLSPH